MHLFGSKKSMIHRIFVIIGFTFLCFSGISNLICSGEKIAVGLIYVNPNDSLKIIVRD